MWGRPGYARLPRSAPREVEAKVTPARHRWLAKLAAEGPCKRPTRSRVGCDCNKLGWTEWDMRLRETGEPITEAEASERFGERYGKHIDFPNWKERLTPAGRAVLAQAGKPPAERKRKGPEPLADTPENRRMLAEDLYTLRMMQLGQSSSVEDLAARHDVAALQSLIRQRERLGKPYYPVT